MRKQSNKRGKNSRRIKYQSIPEAPMVRDENGTLIENPNYGRTRVISHLNIVHPPKDKVNYND